MEQRILHTRWIAEILERPGVIATGATRQEAQEKVEARATSSVPS